MRGGLIPAPLLSRGFEMNKDLSVREMPHLVRRGNSPGVLTNTNTSGFRSTITLRERLKRVDSLESEVGELRDMILKLMNGGQTS